MGWAQETPSNLLLKLFKRNFFYIYFFWNFKLFLGRRPIGNVSSKKAQETEDAVAHKFLEKHRPPPPLLLLAEEGPALGLLQPRRCSKPRWNRRSTVQYTASPPDITFEEEENNGTYGYVHFNGLLQTCVVCKGRTHGPWRRTTKELPTFRYPSCTTTTTHHLYMHVGTAIEEIRILYIK